MIGFTKDEVLEFFRNILDSIKAFFAWLGILVLPNKDELPTAPVGTDGDANA